jgi:hypothetical protein
MPLASFSPITVNDTLKQGLKQQAKHHGGATEETNGGQAPHRQYIYNDEGKSQSQSSMRFSGTAACSNDGLDSGGSTGRRQLFEGRHEFQI